MSCSVKDASVSTPPPGETGTAMLTRLHVKGYKSLNDAEVALKPLTLLVDAEHRGHRATC